MMLDIIQNIIEVIDNKETAALATIVNSSVSSPTILGRKLLVRVGRDPIGSLGSEHLNRSVIDGCLATMRSGKPTILEYETLDEEAPLLGLPQGTRVDVFVEVFRPVRTLVILGAGHIAQPLCKMGKILGFEVVVIDDRAEFANVERFPEADRVIAADFAETLRSFPVIPNTYIVLITRGHRHDEVSLREVIASPAAYIGMIGSRRRVAAVFHNLSEEGVPAELIEKVYAPIGLDIGAESPEEIALSIIAEVVRVIHKGTGQSLSLARKAQL
ncbi:MAG: XdhC/CoxI family protein [Chloroflexi bacterium]|nr:XdhC/CoxI family protein [Chloroflexota bacterium]MCL5075857.1 XdhC/CoxI family protein [Chloroflexota bacterium]